MIDIDLMELIEEKYVIIDENGWRIKKEAPQWVRKEIEEKYERIRLEQDEEHE